MPYLASTPSRWVRPRPERIIALLAVRNDIRFLPGYFASVGPQVDGVVAFDDDSKDGSAEYLEGRAEVIELIRAGPGRTHWDEAGNYRRLVDAGVRHGADWLVSVDADERVERDFRGRLEWVIARGRLFGLSSYHVRLRELWDSPDHYRHDGIWGAKTRSRIFRARPGARLDPRPLHASKVPLDDLRPGRSAIADLELYHLRMVDPQDRGARRQRYELADPDSNWQPGVGYAYLTDERGLQLKRIESARGYDGRSDGAQAVDGSPSGPAAGRQTASEVGE